ncbi:MAG TPA: hypothetical protein VFG00_03200, partial [Acidothermaceae bacterium]|nr:hypothetical protein [Acidothermaceae bacterium]
EGLFVHDRKEGADARRGSWDERVDVEGVTCGVEGEPERQRPRASVGVTTRVAPLIREMFPCSPLASATKIVFVPVSTTTAIGPCPTGNVPVTVFVVSSRIDTEFAALFTT